MRRESQILEPALEREMPERRKARLEQRLRETVALAVAKVPRVKRSLKNADEIRTLEDLRKLPITNKDDLHGLQLEEPPLAGLLVEGELEKLQRLFASPGPLHVPQGAAPDYWRFRHAFAATGFRAGDVVLNTLAYQMTPGGFMLDA